MIWCTFDIIRFRRQWADLTGDAKNNEDYMAMTEQHSQRMSYFPDVHNTGGLFMRVGAGSKYTVIIKIKHLITMIYLCSILYG
jgi:hypothetical protein